MGELDLETDLVEEFPWEWREAFLALNPAGELPVLKTATGTVVSGAYAISEFLADEQAAEETPREDIPLFPGNPAQRAEVRRLVDWFHGKMNREVTRELLAEKVYSRMRPDVPQAPDAGVIRAIRANLHYHMSYISHLADQHGWLASDDLSFADMAAAAHLSCADYLGEVPWDDYPAVRTWYSRIKSRKSFRPILTDRLPGVAPPLIYTDLDF